MTTRESIQAKRNAGYRKRDQAVTKLNAQAREYEQRAASIAHTIATLDEERMKLLIESAMLRREARG